MDGTPCCRLRNQTGITSYLDVESVTPANEAFQTFSAMLIPR